MHGLFEWVDLSAPDLATVSVFYSELFGGECNAEGGVTEYPRCRKDGRLAAGIALAPDSPAAWRQLVDELAGKFQPGVQLAEHELRPERCPVVATAAVPSGPA